MNRATRFSMMLALVLMVPWVTWAQVLPRIEIEPGDLDILLDDSIRFSVTYLDTAGQPTDTLATWSIHPHAKATIDDSGWFFPNSPGECLLTAILDTLSDQVTVSILSPDEDPPEHDGNNHLSILPSDTLVSPGSPVQYQAFFGDTLLHEDSLITWNLLGMPIGTLDQHGLLQVTAAGFGLVEAISGEHAGAGFILAAETESDTSDINHIRITRDSPNPRGYSLMRELNEGETWTISGLPHPMNILNGSRIFFPLGSLSEDIRIHIALPGFFQVGPDTVNTGHDHVLAGVQFQVMTDDSTIVEPYLFDSPLIAGLVYKRGLMDQLGFQPDDLGLYFGMDLGDSVSFDETGITHTLVDPYSNRVYAAVAHFSTLLVAGNVSAAGIEVRDWEAQPKTFTLHQNYPNPFNPGTRIRYTLEAGATVRLSILDVNGREVVELIQDYLPPGSYQLDWDACDAQGRPVAAGVYLCCMQTPSLSQTVKMVLLK